MVTDEDLLRRFLEGDDDAFEQLVSRYEVALRRLAFGFLRDWSAAEDVAQEAFMRAYHKASSFRQGGSFRAWLYRIAINRARDELRRRHRRRESSLEPNLVEMVEHPGSPETTAAARELEQRLASAVAELRDEYRTPLVLREVEGMTYREIAEFLGWPLGTVQARLHRARLELRSLLKGWRG